MQCNASYARFILEGFSYVRQIDMQPICTPMLAKIYSCKKWVLHLYMLILVEIGILMLMLDLLIHFISYLNLWLLACCLYGLFVRINTCFCKS
jgi:hypothetical protein